MFTLKCIKYVSARCYLIYNKLQVLLLSIFVFGILDVLLYSDLLMALIVIPEFTPIVIMIIFGYGLYRFMKYKTKRNTQPSDE